MPDKTRKEVEKSAKAVLKKREWNGKRIKAKMKVAKPLCRK